MKIKLDTSLEKKFLKKWGNFIFNFAFSILATLIIIVFNENMMMTLFLEILLGIAGLVKWRSYVTLSIFAIGGAWGALIEILIMHNSGAWIYALPTITAATPFWLMIIWANTSAFIYETAKEVNKLGVKK